MENSVESASRWLICAILLLALASTCSALDWSILPRATRALQEEEDVPLKQGTFPFADIEAYYQMYDNPDRNAPVVLFLHGARFTSDDWVRIGTLETVRKQGYRAVAVDLPGYGKTRHLPYVDNNMRSEFIKAALEFAARGSNLTSVLVTPSMSGKWAIPFLDRYGLMLAGWVALAPVGVAQWGGPWEYTHRQVQLLAMYGSSDPMFKDAHMLSRLFARSQIIEIKDAGHACYIEKPEIFHHSLKPFLTKVTPEFVIEDTVPQDL